MALSDSGSPPPKRLTALVTGSNGFSGSHMVELLVSRGYDVVGMDLGPDKAAALAGLDFQYGQCDLSDRTRTFNEVIKRGPFDLVFHVAGLIDLDASQAELDRVNVGGTVNLIDALRCPWPRPSRIVLWSSASVYGRGDGRVFTENDRPRPQEGYPASKLAAEEQALIAWKRHGLRPTIIRPGGIYGPRGRSGFAVSIFAAARGGLGPFYAGSRRTGIGMVHVTDVCRAAEFLAREPSAVGETYNVKDDSDYRSAELIGFIAAELGFPFLPGTVPVSLMKGFVKRLERAAAKRGRVSLYNRESIEVFEHDLRFDSSKLRSLGWRPEFPDTKDGLRRTIEWYRKEGWL